MSNVPAHPRPRSGNAASSMTSEVDKNNLSLYDNQSDQLFAAPAFGNSEDPADKSRTGDVEDEEMPSNLMNSRSNVPGMTPQDLLAAHRRSIAALPGNEDRDLDLHSLTLSRHQVEPEDVYRADMDDLPDEEFQECLNSFKFGQVADEADEALDSIHSNH